MKQVVKLKSSKNHYRAGACILWCVDARLTGLDDPRNSLLIRTIKELGFEKPDVFIIAGGAKELASYNERTAWLLDQIEISIKLHQPPVIVLVVHRDCGAYGKMTSPDEDSFFADELKKAKRRVLSYLETTNYSAEVKVYLADFEGLWEADQD